MEKEEEEGEEGEEGRVEAASAAVNATSASSLLSSRISMVTTAAAAAAAAEGLPSISEPIFPPTSTLFLWGDEAAIVPSTPPPGRADSLLLGNGLGLLLLPFH